MVIDTSSYSLLIPELSVTNLCFPLDRFSTSIVELASIMVKIFDALSKPILYCLS